jgi:predicted Zn-dependent protease
MATRAASLWQMFVSVQSRVDLRFGNAAFRSTAVPALAVLAFALAGCDVSQEEEVAVGHQTAAQIDAQLPLVDDPAIDGYINALGNSIARRADTRGLDWRFRVVDSRAVNAFAVPGGYVYVNRGLIERAENLSELAGVLGHEIGHVTLRHSAEQMQTARKTNFGLTLLCTLTNICQSDAARVAIDVGGSALFARHSRGDEREADSVAVLHVVAADISPAGVPALFETLLAERARQPGRVESWFATHPLEESRVEQTRRWVAAVDDATRATLVVDSPEFQEFKRRVAALPPPVEPSPGP